MGRSGDVQLAFLIAPDDRGVLQVDEVVLLRPHELLPYLRGGLFVRIADDDQIAHIVISLPPGCLAWGQAQAGGFGASSDRVVLRRSRPVGRIRIGTLATTTSGRVHNAAVSARSRWLCRMR